MSQAATEREGQKLKCVYHPGLGRINLTVPSDKVRAWSKIYATTKGRSWTTLRFDYPFTNCVFREEWKVKQKGFEGLLKKWRRKYIEEFCEISFNELLLCAKFALCFGEANMATMEMAVHQWYKDDILQEEVSLMRKTLFDDRIGEYPFAQLNGHLKKECNAHRLSIHLLKDMSTPQGYQLIMEGQKKYRQILNRAGEEASDDYQGAVGLMNAAGTVPIARLQEMNRGVRLIQGKKRGPYGSRRFNPGTVAV